MKSLITKRSTVIAGHKTSVSLEDEFWKGLQEIAKQREETLSHLIASIDADRQHANLSSAIRLYVLAFYQDQYQAEAALDHSIRQSPDANGFRALQPRYPPLA
jgi:predicted DNA-binding ribbon-helix-helix protein